MNKYTIGQQVGTMDQKTLNKLGALLDYAIESGRPFSLDLEKRPVRGEATFTAEVDGEQAVRSSLDEVLDYAIERLDQAIHARLASREEQQKRDRAQLQKLRTAVWYTRTEDNNEPQRSATEDSSEAS